MLGHTRAMVQLAPLVQRGNFLDGWRAESRYEANIPLADAETRYNDWLADVDDLFKASGMF